MKLVPTHATMPRPDVIGASYDARWTNVSPTPSEIVATMYARMADRKAAAEATKLAA